MTSLESIQTELSQLFNNDNVEEIKHYLFSIKNTELHYQPHFLQCIKDKKYALDVLTFYSSHIIKNVNELFLVLSFGLDMKCFNLKIASIIMENYSEPLINNKIWLNLVKDYNMLLIRFLEYQENSFDDTYPLLKKYQFFETIKNKKYISFQIIEKIISLQLDKTSSHLFHDYPIQMITSYLNTYSANSTLISQRLENKTYQQFLQFYSETNIKYKKMIHFILSSKNGNYHYMYNDIQKQDLLFKLNKELPDSNIQVFKNKI